MNYQNRIQLLKSEAKPADDINISEVIAKRKRDFFQNLAQIYEKKTNDTKNTTKIFNKSNVKLYLKKKPTCIQINANCF